MLQQPTITEGQRQQALGASTIAFMACFAVWTIFSIIGIRIQKELGLNDTEFGLLVGTPILTGAVSRLFIGILADRFGGRKVMALVMLIAAAAAFMLSYAHSYLQFLISALFMGVAGGSFAAGVAYVARWYPKERTGTALGIFGIGTLGTDYLGLTKETVSRVISALKRYRVIRLEALDIVQILDRGRLEQLAEAGA